MFDENNTRVPINGYLSLWGGWMAVAVSTTGRSEEKSESSLSTQINGNQPRKPVDRSIDTKISHTIGGGWAIS